MNDDTRPLAEEDELVGGNRVRVLIDGPQTYRDMFDAIDAAEQRICIVAYQLDDSDVGQALGQKLEQAAERGVVVRLLFDAFGSLETSREFVDRLEQAGIRTRVFNPIADVVNGADVNYRNHRKLLIVDDRTSYTGGINFAEGYVHSDVTGDSFPDDPPEISKPWRDTHLRIDGPAVRLFTEQFADDWNESGADDRLETTHPIDRQGDDLVRIAIAGAGDAGAAQNIYETYLRAFLKARSRIWITQAYFAPDDRFLDVLLRAAGSGIDVRLILPAHSDSRVMIAAARSYYSTLLDVGIRIYERNNVLLHAKTALIDDYWITIGSSNLDQRSFKFNRELNAVVVSRSAAEQLERLFHHDVDESTEIERESWHKRPVHLKLFQHAARSVRQWL